MSGLITADPNICHGKPTIAGTRIMVATIEGFDLAGFSVDEIQEQYPQLTREQILAAIRYELTPAERYPWLSPELAEAWHRYQGEPTFDTADDEEHFVAGYRYGLEAGQRGYNN